MDNSIFQNIFDKIQEFLPYDWQKMIFFAGYTSGSYSMKFYIKTEQEACIDCFNIPGVSKAKLIKLFMEIDQIIKKERDKLNEKNKWSILTITVDSNGSMNADFDYADHSEDMISFENEWKKKNIGSI